MNSYENNNTLNRYADYINNANNNSLLGNNNTYMLDSSSYFLPYLGTTNNYNLDYNASIYNLGKQHYSNLLSQNDASRNNPANSLMGLIWTEPLKNFTTGFLTAKASADGATTALALGEGANSAASVGTNALGIGIAAAKGAWDLGSQIYRMSQDTTDYNLLGSIVNKSNGLVGYNDIIAPRYSTQFHKPEKVSWTKTMGRDMLEDTLTGASLGTAIAPGWGTLIGTGAGLINGISRGAAEYAHAKKNYKQDANLYNLAENVGRLRYMNGIEGWNNTYANKQHDALRYHMADFGGKLFNPTFKKEMIEVNEGGTHEENPLGGVPMGINMQDGLPNLVEQGEAIFNNYVFSNNKDMKVPLELLLKYGVKKKDVTYSDFAKMLYKEKKERPNDEISRNTFLSSISELMQALEFERMKQQRQEELKNALMQYFQNGYESKGGEGEEYDFGGHLFGGGGYKYDKNLYKMRNIFEKSNTLGYLPYLRNVENVRELENTEKYKAWSMFVDNYLSGEGETDEEFEEFFKALTGVTGTEKQFFKDGKLKRDATTRKLWNKYRTDGKYGYFHLTPEIDEVEIGELPQREMSDTTTISPREPIYTPEYLPQIVKDNLLRYMGLLGPVIGLGLNASDKYTPQLVPHVNNDMVIPDPIGNYVTYNPVDEYSLANRQNAINTATARAVANSNSPGRNAALIASLMVNNEYLGQLHDKARALNLDNYLAAVKHNAAIDQYNATNRALVQQFNAQQRAAENQLNQTADRANVQNNILHKQAKDETLSTNLNNLFSGIAGIGTEWYNRNWTNSLYNAGYFGSGAPIYQGPFGIGDYVNRERKAKEEKEMFNRMNNFFNLRNNSSQNNKDK